MSDITPSHNHGRFTASLFVLSRGLRTKLGLALGLGALAAVPISAAALHDDTTAPSRTHVETHNNASAATTEPSGGQPVNPEPQSSTGSANWRHSSSTKVTVNGQDVPVPQNGTTHTTITNNGNNVNVQVEQHQSSSTGSSQNSSSTSTQIDSSSSTSTSVGGGGVDDGID